MAKRKAAPPPPAISVSTRRAYKHLADVKIDEPSPVRLPHPGGTSQQPGAEKASRKAARTQRTPAPRRMKTSVDGLRELSELMGKVRPKSGITFLFSQHLDANLERKLRRLLTGMRRKPVVVHEPGERVKLRRVEKELRDRTTELNQVRDDITSILGNIQIPIIIVGSDLYIRYASDAAKVLLSKRLSDTERKITDTMLSLYIPDLKERISHVTESLQTTEHEFQDDDGRWKMLRVQPFMRSDKTSDGVVVTLFDIDKHRTVKTRLRYEESRMRHLLETVSGVVVILDTDQQVRVINAEGCRLLGYAEQDILGRNWFDSFIPDSLRAETKGTFGRLMVRETVDDEAHEISLLTATGEEKVFLWRSSLLSDEAGTPLGLLSCGQDVSGWRKAEQVAHQGEERLRMVMETARCDEFMTIDPTGNLLTWMAGTESGKRVRGEAVMGSHFSSLFPVDDLVAGKPMRILSVADSEGWYEGEGWCVGKDGSQRRALTTVVPQRAADGTLQGFSSVIHYLDD